MKPEEVFTGEWSRDEDGFYHLLSGGIRNYDEKILSKLKTMRATAPMWINYDLPSLVEMNNEGTTYIYGDAQLSSLVEMNNDGYTHIYHNTQLNALVEMNNRGYTSIYNNAQLNALVEMNNEGDTFILGNVQLPLLEKPKAKFVAAWLDGWYGCRISSVKDWDSFYSEFRAVTGEFYFWQGEKENLKLLSPDEFLSFIKLRGI